MYDKQAFELRVGANTKELKADHYSDEHKNLLSRVSKEFRKSYEYLQGVFDEWEKRQKLRNNQMKDKLSVSVPMIWTTMNTVVASLYDDKLAVKHIPYSESGAQRAENLDILALNDYRVMDKAMMDYFWIDNAAFYGYSPLLMQGWDADKKVPLMELMDPMTFFYDPLAVFVNPQFGKPGLRFFGRQRYKSLDALKNDKRYMNIDKAISFLNFGGGAEGVRVQEAKKSRDEAMNQIFDTSSVNLGGPQGNALVTEWWTFNDLGERVYIEVLGDAYRGLEKSCIIRMEKLEFQNEWGLINRVLMPIHESFRGLSIPDLIEDKQRYTAKFLNLALKNAEFATYGMYMVNQKQLPLDQVGAPAPNKLIPVDGDPTNVMVPVAREGLRNEFQWVMNYMDATAQQATATPAVIQGMTPDNSRSATEIATQRMGVDRRYSLSAKILGWSEKQFYEQWYRCYDKFFPEGTGEKVIRLIGELGTTFQSLKRTDFMDKKQPEVYIESSVMSEIERTTKLQGMTNIIQVIAQDPNVNKRYMFRKLGKLNDLSTEEINMLVPPTPEELHARGENDLILDGKTPKIDMMDDHLTHIELHAQLPESKIRDAHISAHKKAMLLARQNPEIMPAPNAVNPANAMEANPELAAMAGAGVQSNPTNMSFTPNNPSRTL